MWNPGLGKFLPGTLIISRWWSLLFQICFFTQFMTATTLTCLEISLWEVHLPPCFCWMGTVPVPQTQAGKLFFSCCLNHPFNVTGVESLKSGRQGSVSFPDCIVESLVTTSLRGQGTQHGARNHRSHEEKEWTTQMLLAVLFAQAPSHQLSLVRLIFLPQLWHRGEMKNSQYISSSSILSQ